MKLKTTSRINGKTRTLHAVQWDGTAAGAEEVFAFVGDAECRITDEAVVEIYPDGLDNDPVEVQPGQWLLHLGLRRYFVCDAEILRRRFEPAGGA